MQPDTAGGACFGASHLLALVGQRVGEAVPTLGPGFCLTSICAGLNPEKTGCCMSALAPPPETRVYIVGKRTQRAGPTKPRKVALARFSAWEEREWAAAQAVRCAVELAFHVGIKSHGEVIFWDGEGVCFSSR